MAENLKMNTSWKERIVRQDRKMAKPRAEAFAQQACGQSGLPKETIVAAAAPRQGAQHEEAQPASSRPHHRRV